MIVVSHSFLKVASNQIKKDYGTLLTEEQIFSKIFDLLIYDGLISGSFNEIKWEVSTESFQGLLIPSKKLYVHFTQMLSVDGKARSRNTFLNQNFQTTLKLAEKNKFDISISINPFDLEKSRPTANYIITSFREAVTQGAIMNKSLQGIKGEKINNLNDYIFERSLNKNKNSGNYSGIIDLDNKNRRITIYGRLDGANAKDTISMCKTIQILNKDNYFIEFFDVTPNTKVNEGIKKEIQNIVSEVCEVETMLENLKTNLMNNESYEELERDQATFKANIIKKYLDIPGFDIHKCFASDYFIETNLIAAHIYRFADIKRDYKNGKISVDQAAHLIVSGDNGFLLSPNIDKEFEKGQIIFDPLLKSFTPNMSRLSPNEVIQVNNSLNSPAFPSEAITPEFICNVSEHLKRVRVK